jgi:hypothetical protein
MAKRDEERERRLAQALRENLRRRKAQARAQTLPGDGEAPAGAEPHGGEPPRRRS